MFSKILFSSNEYFNPHFLKRYVRFISQLINLPKEGYTENHHIVPVCLFPEYKNFKSYPWNKITLSARQHLIAHYMLMKAFPKNWKLALSVLKTAGQYHTVNAQNTRLIAEARMQASIRRKGWKPPPVSDETRKKISEQKTAYYANPENRLKQSQACKGTTGRTGNYYYNKSEEHKKNLSLSLTGKKRGPFTEEHKAKISASSKGKKKTPEHLSKLGDSIRNQQRYNCEHCNLQVTAANLKRWHGNNCKIKLFHSFNNV